MFGAAALLAMLAFTRDRLPRDRGLYLHLLVLADADERGAVRAVRLRRDGGLLAAGRDLQLPDAADDAAVLARRAAGRAADPGADRRHRASASPACSSCSRRGRGSAAARCSARSPASARRRVTAWRSPTCAATSRAGPRPRWRSRPCRSSLGGLLLLLVAPLGELPDELPGVEAWLSILALGALGTGVAYVLNFNVVRAAGAQTGSMVTYLVPVFAVVFGVSILGEPLSWHEPAGGALIIAGVALAQRRPARRPSTL